MNPQPNDFLVMFFASASTAQRTADLGAITEPTAQELDYASRYLPANVRRIEGAELDTRTTQEMEVCR